MKDNINIIAAIDIEANHDSSLKLVAEAIYHAPKITGIEQKAEVFVSRSIYPTGTIASDCNSCPFKHTLTVRNNRTACEAPINFKCRGAKRFYDNYVITICGMLDGTSKTKVQKEFNNFYAYINKYYKIKKTAQSITEQV